MANRTDSKTEQRRDGNLAMLCGAAFLVSASGFTWWVALPFIMKKFGGSDTDVGLCFAGNMGCYLLTCAATATFLDRLKAKSTVLCSAITQAALLTAMLCLILWHKEIADFFSPVYSLIIISSLAGINIAFFWPCLMGWVSLGHEGAALNHRLGVFNTNWSLAGVIASLAAGYLAEINYALVLAMAIILLGLAAIVLSFTRCSSKTAAKQAPGGTETLHTNHARFRWMARVGLLVAFICMGLVRSHVPLLFKFTLGFSELQFGTFIMFFSGTNFLMLTMLGRSFRWHYKANIYAMAHIPVVLSLVMILFCKQLAVLYIAAGLIGITVGFIYSSHLYYGISGGSRRSGLMAIHEGLLAMGFIVGAWIGGYLSDTFGAYTPYWFGLAAVITGAIAEVIIYFAVKPAKAQVSQAPASH